MPTPSCGTIGAPAERGLDEREKSEALLLSRHYFERMYQTNNRDLAALVMLFYLDSRYFTALQGQVDWLEKLDDMLTTRTLQASDWNALALFFELFGSEADLATDARVMRLLDTLAGRYPRSTLVPRFRYQYLAGKNAEPAQLLPLLQRAQELAPGAIWVYYALLRESGRNEDVAGMYEYARLWLAHDPQRYRLSQIKALFAVANPESGSSDD